MVMIQDLREGKKYYKESFKQAKATVKQLMNDMSVSEKQAKETIQNLSEKVNKLRKMLQVNKRENGNSGNESQKLKSNVSISEEEHVLINQRLKAAIAKSRDPCKRIYKTIYIGNLAYSADVSEAQDRLRKVFISTRLEKVVIPTTDGQSRGYGFVTISWPKDAPIRIEDVCNLSTGFKIGGRRIYLEPANREIR